MRVPPVPPDRLTGVQRALFDRIQQRVGRHTAASVGLTPVRIATITAGSRPPDLSTPEGVAYDVAHALVGGGRLPQSVYDLARHTVGDDGSDG